jgi:hypothetical protein
VVAAWPGINRCITACHASGTAQAVIAGRNEKSFRKEYFN